MGFKQPGRRLGETTSRIRVIETGVIYKTQTELARALGVSNSLVNNTLNGRNKRCKGYTLEYVDR